MSGAGAHVSYAKQGQTLRQIAAQLGASPSTISTDLRAINVPPEAAPNSLAAEPRRRPLARVPTPGRPPLALVRAALRQLSR